MRPCGTRFYGGAVLIVSTTSVGVVAKERAKGRYAKYVDGRGWIKHAARHIICVILFLLSVRTKRKIPTSWVVVLTPSAVSSVTLVGVRLPWKSLRSLLMMDVA